MKQYLLLNLIYDIIKLNVILIHKYIGIIQNFQCFMFEEIMI